MSTALAISILFHLQDPAAKEAEREIRSLIDKLVEVADQDIGYGASWSGSNFSALEEDGKQGARIMDGKTPKGSPIMRALVKRGAAAAPLLIEHLGDVRKTKITVKHKGDMGAMSFSAEYDFNSRIAKAKPVGVNRDLFGDEGKRSDEHTLTVGDLCFVALGQIVNRQFNAIRYQPTAIIVVNSPTVSKELLTAAKNEWADLTAEKHRNSLMADVRTPDFPGRSEGAILRLGYYFPESAEKLVLDQLSKPAYCIFRVEEFLRGKLYATADAKEWKRLFDEWTAKEGAAFKDGLLLYLLEDVVDEEERKEWKAKPASVLAKLFPGVDPAKPHFPDVVTQGIQARFIDAVGRFHSAAVDAAVLDQFRRLGSGRFKADSDDYFALACMRYLIGRSHDGLFKEYCAKRIPKSEYHAKELQEMLDLLNAVK